MHHFFVDADKIDDKKVYITGTDVNHIKNVLRMKSGEDILISDGVDKDYYCKISDISDEMIQADIINIEYAGSELLADFYLFQCLPKGDKMEMVIQKAVELGAKKIIPVASKRAVVKLDDKKALAKVKRWQTISENAAKQSRRVIIPEVKNVMTFKQAVEYASNLDMNVIPYENYKDMTQTKKVIDKIGNNMKVGIFIGPEGGFAPEEIDFAAENGIEKISLGKRILRTETAGMTLLSVLMFKMEK